MGFENVHKVRAKGGIGKCRFQVITIPSLQGSGYVRL
jgi:hypothetical protein